MDEYVAVVAVGESGTPDSLVDAVGRTLRKKAGTITFDTGDYHIYVVSYSLDNFKELQWAIIEMVYDLGDLRAYDHVEIVTEVDGKHVATTALIGDCTVEEGAIQIYYVKE